MSLRRWRLAFVVVLAALASCLTWHPAGAEKLTMDREPAERESALAPVTPALPGPIDPALYRVGPGDALTIWIWGPIARTVSLTVSPEGQLFLPDLGPVPVAGLTLTEARRRVVDRVGARYRGVQVEVQLQRVRRFIVYLSGRVRSAGPLMAGGASRLADLLPDSILDATASRRNIVVRHTDGTQEICDLGLFQVTGDLARVPYLRDGDVIEVPEGTCFVGAWGAVARSDRFELGPEDSLSTLLRMAGGLLPSALAERALLVRWQPGSVSESLWVSLGPRASGDLTTRLRDGDNLYVFEEPEYHEAHRVTVVGQVVRAGVYPIGLGSTRLSDIIRATGGFRPDADSSAVQLIRARPERTGRDPEFERLARLSRDQMTTSEYESFRARLAALAPEFRVDWRRIRPGHSVLDPLLQADDVIRVERTARMVRVDGQVRRPGLVEFREGEPCSYYVRTSGGFSARAARTQVRVTRLASGQTLLAKNVDAVAPGDFIWVPERPDVGTWQHLKDVLTIAAAFATIWLAFKR